MMELFDYHYCWLTAAAATTIIFLSLKKWANARGGNNSSYCWLILFAIIVDVSMPSLSVMAIDDGNHLRQSMSIDFDSSPFLKVTPILAFRTEPSDLMLAFSSEKDNSFDQQQQSDYSDTINRQNNNPTTVFSDQHGIMVKNISKKDTQNNLDDGSYTSLINNDGKNTTSDSPTKSFLNSEFRNVKNDSKVDSSLKYIRFRDTVRFLVQRILVPILMIVGVIGNSITMVIMTRRRMRSSTNWYLAALAIFDMIYLICTFVLSLQHYPNAHSIDYYYYWKFFPYFMMIVDASSNTSVWLTVSFTIERYIAVCHPIKGKVICTESRAKRIIFCVFIVCLSITLPVPFEWKIVEIIDEKYDRPQMRAHFSELGQNETYKNVYYCLTVFVFVFLPLCLLVIFNSFLIRSVHISQKQRSQMMMGKDKFSKSSPSAIEKNNTETTSSANASSALAHSSQQEIRITVMLIAVVILFIICQTPTACRLIYETFHEYDPTSNEGYLLVALNNIFNFLMSFHAAGNFVLYCLLSQKYRRTFVNMFCPCLSHGYLNNQSNFPKSQTKNFSLHTSSTGVGNASVMGRNHLYHQNNRNGKVLHQDTNNTHHHHHNLHSQPIQRSNRSSLLAESVQINHSHHPHFQQKQQSFENNNHHHNHQIQFDKSSRTNNNLVIECDTNRYDGVDNDDTTSTKKTLQVL